MKALAIFKRDPAPKLKTARELLAAAETRLAAVQRDRGAALVESDDIETLRRQDREIDDLGRAIVTYRDRIAALEAEQRRQDHARRVREQQEAIDKIVAPAVAAYVAHGAELQKVFLHFLDLYEGLPEKRRAIHAAWPAAAPRPNYDLWDSYRTEPFNIGVGNIRFVAKQIAEKVAKNGADFLAKCREVKIPEPDDDYQENAA
jgi:hypothetical protein